MAHLFEETRLVGVLNAPSIARAMAAAPYLDAGLHDLDLPARRRDAQPEAGQGTVEQEGVLGLWLALAGQARGEVNGGHGGLLPRAPRPFRTRSHGYARHPVSGVGNGLVRQVGIAFGGLDQGMTEQLGDGHHVRRSWRQPKPSCIRGRPLRRGGTRSASAGG